jgi:hypothetical protein
MALAARIEPAAKRVGDDRGTAVIEGLLTFGLIVLVFVFGVQAVMYVHARSVAQTAAQEGARSAVTDGAAAGSARASATLRPTTKRLALIAHTQCCAPLAVPAAA